MSNDGNLTRSNRIRQFLRDELTDDADERFMLMLMQQHQMLMEVGRMGLSPLQKCTAAIRQLAYGAPVDQSDEYLRLAETTAIDCLINFCKCVYEVFGDQYLRRPTAADTQHLLEMHERRHGFLGMLGSLDYGIYPTWATFVKSFPCPEDPKRKKFKERQEAARKDVERAFGVLQARWAIVRGPVRYWSRDILRDIMHTCIILHNMIIEDEGDAVSNWMGDEENHPTRVKQGSTLEFQEYLRRNCELRDSETHHQLRADLVEHIWALDENNQ
ncbi:uncharacterized protein LOC122034161 [Zingiber officinale]|uniref:uncharacterized protein LOC122034161 n=1 Tax=Zingiber officinale TaxID=94328 RepID=UPI001C4B559F|nr:uncharacterized protein LOC122034161 [Zingiber officinale]